MTDRCAIVRQPLAMWRRFVAWYVSRLCTCDAYYGIQDPRCNYHSRAALAKKNSNDK